MTSRPPIFPIQRQSLCDCFRVCHLLFWDPWAPGGQFLIWFPPNQNLETVKQVIYKKTVTFFEASFHFRVGIWWRECESKLERVRKAAYDFGMAFQTADDLAYGAR